MNRDVTFPDERVEEKRSRSGSGTGMNIPLESPAPVLATSVTASPIITNVSKPNPSVRSQSRNSKAPPPRDIYQEALLALRGRYLLAAILAIIGAAAGVYAVIQVIHPIYKSEGLLQIALQREAVLNETDQNRPVAMFDAMLRAQVDIIRSRGLLEKALQTTAWQTASGSHGPAKPQQIDDMADDLTVEHPNNTDHLRILKLDRDPQVAAATVNAIIDAYSKTYESRESTREQERLEALQKEKSATEQELTDVRARLEELVQTVAGGDIEARYDNASRRMTMLDTLLANVKLQQGLKQSGGENPQGVRNLALDRVARNDPGMKALTARKRQFEDELDTLLHGPNKLLENNPSVVEKRRQIAKADEEIQQYGTQLKDLQLDIVDQLGGTGLTSLPGGDLENQDRVITAMKSDLGKEIAGLVKTKGLVSQLKASASRLGEDVDRYDKRIRDLRLEASIGGRLSVISNGEVPLKPFYDPRQKLAIAGGMIGGGIPVALLVLIGLMSGKYRFVNETSGDMARTAPLLGMLPTLPETLTSMRQVADAAHSVHQIRAMLQMGEAGTGRSVYMVTSATSGEGKTNLTVALGLSFAAAGCKTLVVDCDLVGQGITRGFRAEKTTGLREALACGSARGFVKKLPQGLRLLTAGTADTVSGWTLSAAATNRMLSEVRRYYDIVLIDTGPILGSVEAAVLAPAVDGVILTISRGQQRSLVDRANQLLVSLGADTAGFVFNRAKNQDLKHTSYYSSGTQYSSVGGNLPEPRMEDTSEVAAFGPLVRSVATFMRTPSDFGD